MIGVSAARRGSFLEASAGTGKTTALVQAIADAIAEGVAVDRIVAVTFTHQAAGEMKLRVRQKLEDMHTDTASAAVQALDRAFIGTIHAFCASLLRQRPIEAHVDPDFQEMDQGQARRLFTDVFRYWLERQLNGDSPVLRRAFARLSWMDDSSGPIRELENAAWQIVEWRDHPAEWEKRAVDRKGSVEALLAQADAMLAMWPSGEAQWARNVFKEVVARLTTARAAGIEDLDDAESELLSIRKRLAKFQPNKKTDFGRGWGEFIEDVKRYAAAADADLASHLRDLLWGVVEEYETAKRRSGQLDFTDLLLKTRNLLRHEGARAGLQARYDRVFVDEFQDTDPLQAEIIKALASPEKLFLVGDPKQSIYRFRRAEPRVYTDTRAWMADEGSSVRALTVSYRSTDAIQEFVNAAFQDMDGYSPLEGGPAAPVDQPSIVALPVPRPYEGERILPRAILECTPSAVGAFIQWLLRSGWTVGKERRRMKPEDICILFRRMTNSGRDLSQDYVRCLEARNIEHVLVGSKGLHQREEAAMIRTALRAIEWPDDELSVYALLRGPLFGIDDATLLKFGKLRAFAEREDEDAEFDPIWSALEILRELHQKRNHRPVADTIRRLLSEVRGHAIFAFHAGGVRRLANLHRISELARQWEAGGSLTFRGFVRWLEEEAESGETAEAPVLEQQSGGVRLMTVHKAKGLEFPVVILADPSAGLVGPEGSTRWVDSAAGLCAQRLLRCAPWELIDHAAEEEAAERAEASRVAYVAATRAKDLLVICAVGDSENEDWWLSPLYEVLYPEKGKRASAVEAPGCPRAGGETVLNAPVYGGSVQIRPGLHRPRAGSHSVAWFDPAALELRDPQAQGSGNQSLLAGRPEQVAEGLAKYDGWLSHRASLVEEGSRPRIKVQRVTETGEVAEASSIPVEVMQIASSGARPRGRRYGKLLHAVLQSGGSWDAHGRRLGATREEIEAASQAAAAVLAHPLFAGLKEAYRELPVVVRLEDGTLLEGRVDLAFSDGSMWTVVDYKTDSADRGRYRRQLQLYGLALQKATGLPARGLLVEIS